MGKRENGSKGRVDVGVVGTTSTTTRCGTQSSHTNFCLQVPVTFFWQQSCENSLTYCIRAPEGCAEQSPLRLRKNTRSNGAKPSCLLTLTDPRTHSAKDQRSIPTRCSHRSIGVNCGGGATLRLRTGQGDCPKMDKHGVCEPIIRSTIMATAQNAFQLILDHHAGPHSR